MAVINGRRLPRETARSSMHARLTNWQRAITASAKTIALSYWRYTTNSLDIKRASPACNFQTSQFVFIGIQDECNKETDHLDKIIRADV